MMENIRTHIGRALAFLVIVGAARADEMCTVDHAQQLQLLIGGKTKEQVFLDGGHKLPPDYVAHAVGWMQKHL